MPLLLDHSRISLLRLKSTFRFHFLDPCFEVLAKLVKHLCGRYKLHKENVESQGNLIVDCKFSASALARWGKIEGVDPVFTSLKIYLYFKGTLFEVERILEIVVLDNKRKKFSLGKYILNVVPPGVVLLGSKRNVCSPDSTYIMSPLHLKVLDVSLNVFSYSQILIWDFELICWNVELTLTTTVLLLLLKSTLNTSPGSIGEPLFVGSLETNLINVLPILLQFSKSINYKLLADIGDHVVLRARSLTTRRHSSGEAAISICVWIMVSLRLRYLLFKFWVNFPLHLCTFSLLWNWGSSRNHGVISSQ